MTSHMRHRLALLWRYYQVGIINTLVGYGLFASFVGLGFNQYVAQIIGHLLGMTFNYVTYSRHVFSDSSPAKLRFVIVYGINYLLGLAMLALASFFVRSPYLAGVISIICVSLINFFLLRHLVFRERTA